MKKQKNEEMDFLQMFFVWQGMSNDILEKKYNKLSVKKKSEQTYPQYCVSSFVSTIEELPKLNK
jgi:hypothetical protein